MGPSPTKRSFPPFSDFKVINFSTSFHLVFRKKLCACTSSRPKASTLNCFQGDCFAVSCQHNGLDASLSFQSFDCSFWASSFDLVCNSDISFVISVNSYMHNRACNVLFVSKSIFSRFTSKLGLPTRTLWPSISAATPCPAISSTCQSVIYQFHHASLKDTEIGWLEFASHMPHIWSRSSQGKFAGYDIFDFKYTFVSVPVLSITTYSACVLLPPDSCCSLPKDRSSTCAADTSKEAREQKWPMQ